MYAHVPAPGVDSLVPRYFWPHCRFVNEQEKSERHDEQTALTVAKTRGVPLVMTRRPTIVWNHGRPACRHPLLAPASEPSQLATSWQRKSVNAIQLGALCSTCKARYRFRSGLQCMQFYSVPPQESDSKTVGGRPPCRFDPGLRHQKPFISHGFLASPALCESGRSAELPPYCHPNWRHAALIRDIRTHESLQYRSHRGSAV